MANPLQHAVSSGNRYGGTWEDYLHIHDWFDETKGWVPDNRHRAIRHNAETIIESLSIFDPITLESGRLVPVRRIAEQHVLEDLGLVPTAADYLKTMPILKWMRGDENFSESSTVAHAARSAKLFGGTADLYLPIHQWLDATAGWFPDVRHRAIRHHARGVQEATTRFPPVVLPDGAEVDVTRIAEQHVKDDLGEIRPVIDWLELIETVDWMTGNMQAVTTILDKKSGKWRPPNRLLTPIYERPEIAREQPVPAEARSPRIATRRTRRGA